MLTLAKYSSEPTGSAFMVLAPGCQEAGHTSPCTSTRVKDVTRDREDFKDSEVTVRLLGYPAAEVNSNDSLKKKG